MRQAIMLDLHMDTLIFLLGVIVRNNTVSDYRQANLA
jgi:hypothetical protein